MVGVTEIPRIGQLQDEADATVFYGEDDGGQVARGGKGEIVGTAPLEGFLDLVVRAYRADGGVAGVGHGVTRMASQRAAYPGKDDGKYNATEG